MKKQDLKLFLAVSDNTGFGEKTEQLRKLIRKGSNCNIMDYDKRTPLHVACANKDLNSVKFLLA